ncbi:MAG: DUF2200 domain-containing protein [Flavobacteriaceae bacterium]
MSKPRDYSRVFKMTFGSIYPHYLTKAEKKGHTKEEVDHILEWLTGFSPEGIQDQIDRKTSLQEFFEQAPAMNPNVDLIKGLICGYRVEDIEDPLMQKIRYMDKLIDELARGKKMKSILRTK